MSTADFNRDGRAIIGDRVAETAESFVVMLTSGTALTIARPQATVIINDDDGTP